MNKIKKCRVCKVELSLETNWTPGRKVHCDNICRSCFNVKNKVKQAGPGAQAIQQNRRKRILDFVSEYKLEIGCQSDTCAGHPHHPQVLDLAHIDRATKSEPGRSAYNDGWSLDRVKAEIAKCKVLCANCHRIETQNEQL